METPNIIEIESSDEESTLPKSVVIFCVDGDDYCYQAPIALGIFLKVEYEANVTLLAETEQQELEICKLLLNFKNIQEQELHKLQNTVPGINMMDWQRKVSERKALVSAVSKLSTHSKQGDHEQYKNAFHDADSLYFSGHGWKGYQGIYSDSNCTCVNMDTSAIVNTILAANLSKLRKVVFTSCNSGLGSGSNPSLAKSVKALLTPKAIEVIGYDGETVVPIPITGASKCEDLIEHSYYKPTRVAFDSPECIKTF